MALKIIITSAALLTLSAVVSPISQASLAPVYGAINVAVNHAQAVRITSTIGFSMGAMSWTDGPLDVLPWLAVWAFWIPVLEEIQVLFSGALGPVYGPMLSGFTSCQTVIILAAHACMGPLNKVYDFEAKFGKNIGIFAPVGAAMGIYFGLEKFFSETAFNDLSGLDPVKLQVLMALAFWALALLQYRRSHWKIYLLILPALFHTYLLNPHLESGFSTRGLESSLAQQNWTLLDRQWSNTGYISVIENVERGYRVLRCDHSLLGGEWTLTPKRQQSEGWKVGEPIYSVFEMLEAVRLMELSPRISDEDAKALIIGLGIGTAPKALAAHGIDTTTVEIDPIVYALATKYFGLPVTNNVVVQDAVSFVNSAVSTKSQKYDYIIHDVFTGGAEPLNLFNLEFIQSLRALLTSNGVAAINYAGDLTLPLSGLVLNTISKAFDGQCKIFRDGAPPAKSENVDEDEVDFINMVVFCRNKPGSISFRKPVKADFLESKSRESYLYPRADYEIPFPTVDVEDDKDDVLKRGKESDWKLHQAQGAQRHWKIMRAVVPDRVWELW
ncbi:Hypothetical protein R9X50_00609000 [Acrodontium crateriforme]|uniref:Spermine/spermidine synthase n=1 Tax=Acrodontium crateriforme TaxID=150365 RepID=A0AAQ3M9D3_9PEZI|nr:Hypothetical protein R9X50_00609000 [Acrodontium crateriforme]